MIEWVGKDLKNPGRVPPPLPGLLKVSSNPTLNTSRVEAPSAALGNLE